MKVVCISDTHGQHYELREIPEGDLLIHAGDMTRHGKISELQDFAKWFSRNPHEYKVVVAGNHDHCFEGSEKAEAVNILEEHDIIYLENEYITVGNLLLYGTPYSKIEGNYAFNDFNPVNQGAKESPDILISHGSPYGTMDFVDNWGHTGSPEIKKLAQKLDPKVHVYGHTHSFNEIQGDKVNCSVLDESYNMTGEPIVVHIDGDNQ